MLYLRTFKTNELIVDSNGDLILFKTNNEACKYAGSLGLACWVESEVYNPKLQNTLGIPLKTKSNSKPNSITEKIDLLNFM